MLFQKSYMLDKDENNFDIGGAFRTGVSRNQNPTLSLHSIDSI